MVSMRIAFAYLACMSLSPFAMAEVLHRTQTQACVLTSCLEGVTFSSNEFNGTGIHLSASASMGETPFISWSGSAFAGGSGTVDTPFTGTSAAARPLVRWVDDITPHSTASWSGAGLLRFSYHITGGVDVSSSLTKPPLSTDPVARAGLYFECGTSSGPCRSPDLGVAPPGASALVRRLDYGTSVVDEVIDFDVAVQSDVQFTLGLAMGPIATFYFLTGPDVPVGYSALANADFTGTGRLVAVTLFGGSGIVSDARYTAGSGMDYANIAAIPEPSVYALMLAGLGLVGYAARRRMRA